MNMNKKQIAAGVAAAFGASVAQSVVVEVSLVGTVSEGNMGPSTAIVSSSTATWMYDTVTDVLTASGLYKEQTQIVPTPGQLFTHNVVNLVVGGGAAATATSYSCVEGVFGGGVGASLCGNYNFGSNATNESTTSWGPGTAFSRIIGGDDGNIGPQQDLSQYDGMSTSNVCGGPCTNDGQAFDGTTLIMSNAMSAVAGYGITLRLTDWAVDDGTGSMADPLIYAPANATTNIDVLGNDFPFTENITAFSVTTQPDNGTSAATNPASPTLPDDRANLSIDFTAPPGFTTTEMFTYSVTDDLGIADSATVTVVADLQPVAVDDNANSGGSPISIDVLANDTLGNGPNYTVTPGTPSQGLITNGPTIMCTNPVDCSVDYDPNGATGVATFSYTLEDENGDTDTATVTITIGTGISATPDNVTTDIGVPISIDVLANDANVNVPDFDVAITVAETGGMVTNDPTNCTAPADCALDYTPPPNNGPSDTGAGTYTFTYQVTDGVPASSSAQVTVFVNDVPVANNDSSGDGNIPPEIVTATATALDVQANDTGLTDTPIIVTVSSPPANGTAMVSGSQINYTSDPGFVGMDTFQYTLTDSAGNPNPDVSAPATVSVTVDDEPTAVDDGTMGAPAFMVSEGASLDLDVLANDLGLSDTPLTVAITTPAGLGTATPVNSPGDPATLRVGYLAGNASGFDSFVYQITDASGDQSSATAYVAVADLDVPMAINDSDTTITNEPVATNVLANDTGLVDEPLTVMITSQPANGSVVVGGGCTSQATCLVTYTPDEGYAGGRDTYQYTVMDDDGQTSNVADVNIRVNPIAVDDTVTAFIDTPANTNVLANDLRLTDTPLSVTIETNPSNGSITGVAGCDQQSTCVVTYEPNPGFTGSDSYQYRFTNNSMEDSNIGTVTLSVNEVPVAADDDAIATAFIATDIDVLANDDGLSFEPLTVTISNPPTSGVASVNESPGAAADISISYTANADDQFTEQFEYTVTDSNGQSSTATVNVSVSGSGGTIPPQDTVPGNKSSLAFGPASLAALLGLPLLRRLRRRRQS